MFHEQTIEKSIVTFFVKVKIPVCIEGGNTLKGPQHVYAGS